MIQLALKDVSVRLPGGILLDRIDLEVVRGESVVLIGPSGHGKTVILKLLAGLLKPSNGEVWIEGHNLQAYSAKDQAEVLLKVGMLFQRNALFDSLTVAENVAFPLREKTLLPEPAISARVSEFLDAVGLGQAHGLFPDEISGGMQKRLGIARALALYPEIVLYDDPTAGLDPITSRRIVDLMLRLRQEHKTTAVTVTNDMARAYQLADRIYMVVDRQLIDTGSPEQTKRNPDPKVRQFIRGLLEGPLTAEM